MNNEPKPPIKPIPPFKVFCGSLGAFPTAFTDSMTVYECLAWLYKYLEGYITPTLNATVTGLAELKEYVEHYFDNLDVQEEINNKLDEMAESGQLEEIIAAYLEVSAVLSYPTVSDMLNADNLQNGSLCETYGFYTINDGGGAKYRIRTITNEDTVDGIHLFAIVNDDTLVAELNEGGLKIDVRQLGAKGDNDTDDTNPINYALLNFECVTFPQGTFICNSENVVCKASKIYGTSLTEIKATAPDDSDYMWRFTSTYSSNVEITNMKFNSNNIRRGCVYISGHEKMQVENCEFTGYSCEYGHYGTDALIILNGGKIGYINNCYFHDSGYQYSSGVTETLNRCISAQDLNELHVENCRFNKVNQAIVTANTINYVNNCDFDYLKDNCIYNLQGADGSGKVGKLIATNNRFANRHSEGIVTSGETNIISNNIFEYIPNSAISINKSMKYLIVNNNVFRELYADAETSTVTGHIIKDRSRNTHTITNFVFSGNTADVSSKPAESNTGSILYVGTVSKCQFNNNIIKYQSINTGRAIQFEGLTTGMASNNIFEDTSNDSTARIFDFTNAPTTFNLKDNEAGSNRISAMRDYIQGFGTCQTNLSYLKSGGSRITTGSAVPTAGTWKQGDIVFNTAPTAGGTLGWICVTAGQPGTWKAISGIAA